MIGDWRGTIEYKSIEPDFASKFFYREAMSLESTIDRQYKYDHSLNHIYPEDKRVQLRISERQLGTIETYG